jgi:acyl-CoA thioester hydrolase
MAEGAKYRALFFFHSVDVDVNQGPGQGPPQFPFMMSTTQTRVRYSETDQMGIVYHTHYLVWCEIGRTEFIRELGVSYAEVEREGVVLAVGEADVRYRAAARYDDVIRIDTTLVRVQSRAVTFAYELYRVSPGPEVRVATAHTTLIALDATGAPRTMPPELLERFRNATTAV